MGKKIQRIGRYTLEGVTLGWGNFAKVDLATHEITRVKVAIKIIDTKKIKDEYVRANLHREARIMAYLRHPHIVRLYETLKATTLYCLVTEYITGGDLLDHVKTRDNQRLDENSSRPYVRQLLSALAYLHERGIVHRDLKMENVLLDERKKNVKIIDFGLSNVCKKRSALKTHCGSPEYAAPELFIAGKTYGPEIDIWSLGVITYAMTVGKLPFSASCDDDHHKHKMLQQIQKGLSAVHEKDMQLLTASCRNLLHQLIEPQPQLRIPLLEIEKHSWITKNGKHPFFRFSGFPRSAVLRNQVIGELSYLSEIKKGILSDLLREKKSNEVSAMFGMMLDKKKGDLGYFDIDHTKHPPCKTSAEKSSTPESCRTTSTLGRKVKTKKNISRSEFLPRRSNDIHHKNNNDARTDPAKGDDKLETQATPNDSCNLIFLSQPYFRHQPTPPTTTTTTTSTTTTTNNNTAAANNCNNYNYNNNSHRSASTTPLKLSMTLDLSVANLSSRADQIYGRPPTARGERRDYDSLYGVAASSGVPPRMSPKEETKQQQQPPPAQLRKTKRSTVCSLSLRKKLVFPCGMGSRETIPETANKTEAKADNNNSSSSNNNKTTPATSTCQGRNGCRPTTLFLKMKGKRSSLFSRSREGGSRKANNGNSCAEVVVAPRASPESSFIDASGSDSGSSDCGADDGNNDSTKCESCNWNAVGSTPMDGQETSREEKDEEEEEEEGGDVIGRARDQPEVGKRFDCFFFSRRISSSLDCILPTIRWHSSSSSSNNNNNNNNNNNIKVVSRQVKEAGKNEITSPPRPLLPPPPPPPFQLLPPVPLPSSSSSSSSSFSAPSFSNRAKVPSNRIDFSSRNRDSRKFSNFHPNNPDTSLGSSSSPSFPTRETASEVRGVQNFDIT